MDDDWRLEVHFVDPRHSFLLLNRLDARQMRRRLLRDFRDCAIVTVDGDRMFVYVANRDQAARMESVVDEEARRHGWPFRLNLRRWHPDAEEWKDPQVPLPHDVATRRRERDLLMERERNETFARGYPEFEVRADLSSHVDAVRLTDQLVKDAVPVVRRWRYLVVGAEDEDSAKRLADLIRQEAPDDARIRVEGSIAAFRGGALTNPFSTIAI